MATYRPTLSATRHAVSAGHHAAAHAGFTILEAGGNAVDAGVAAGIALGVVHTDLVNFAGVAPMVIYRAERREVVTIDGLGTWPRAASIDVFIERHGGKMPPGILRTVIPAAPCAWLTALEHFGTMSFGEVAQAAIRLARDGFPMHWLMAEFIAAHQDDYRRWPSSAAVFLPNGRPPAVGELFVQRDLARTLQYMADQEAAQRQRGRGEGLRAARDAFYRGDIAAAIARYHREHEGWLTLEDMAGYDVRFEPPVHTRFGEIDLYACGPWCQGPVLPQALNIVSDLDLRALGHNSPQYIHTVTEALKLAFADRHRYYGDPRFVQVPLDVLLCGAYAAKRRGAIDPQRAAPGMPEPGDALGSGASFGALPAAARGASSQEPDTSYVCVIDRHGNAFSATPSDASSATPIIPGTGLCPSSRGSQSWCDPALPAAVAPGKRPRLTCSPALALRRGKAFLPFGSPGNDVQPQAMLQVFLNLHVFGMDVQASIEAPRFATYSFPASSAPHAYYPARLNLEARIPRATGEALARLGHDVQWWPDLEWRAGAVCAIRADPERGTLEAGADPRRLCYALGW
ncbi:MAG: gamma-glutamyltransferase family protein [Burkholderiales bacterium]|nr:gamma-glutamyltransferase family protein [Burkholderiales bacterium]